MPDIIVRKIAEVRRKEDKRREKSERRERRRKAEQRREKRSKEKLTVLFRKGGTWSESGCENEVTGLAVSLKLRKGHKISTVFHIERPEYLILLGHFEDEEILEVLDGGHPVTITRITGADSKELPFKPGDGLFA
jgi:hypothetical protein